MKKYIALIIALVCIVMCFASCNDNKPVEVNNDPVGVALSAEGVPFEFYLTAGEDGKAAEATVYMWTEVTAIIKVPETVEYNGHTYPVTAVGLGQNVTADPSSVTTVVLSKNVKTVAKNAFTVCNNLNAVRFEEGLETIESGAFMMTGIEGIELPSSVKTVEKNAFFGCNSLRTVIINQNVESVADSAFGACLNISTINIPRSLESKVKDIFPMIAESCVITYSN